MQPVAVLVIGRLSVLGLARPANPFPHAGRARVRRVGGGGGRGRVGVGRGVEAEARFERGESSGERFAEDVGWL